MHKYMIIKILSNAIYAKKKSQIKADSKLNMGQYCDIETFNLF